MKLDTSHFDAWFRELNNLKPDKGPFPWQRRLFHQWLCPADTNDQRWPRLIKLPTASGKTAVIDLAVLALAAGSACARRRIVFVVDRRVVVDEAAMRATAIATRLRQALADSADPLHDVSRALLALGGEEPLVVAILRGGIAGDDTWARSPAQPAVVLTTVDQCGSRLLFRAYGGHGPRSWPIHAGLLGRDTLLIVDEAHCAKAFCETARAITDRWQDFAEQPIGPRLALVQMSATPDEQPDFELGDDDRNDGNLAPRLSTNKKTELVLVKGPRNADRLGLINEIRERAHARLRLMSSGVVAIVVNRVGDARMLFEQIELPDDRKILLTGRVRGWERDRLLARWLPSLRAGSRQQTGAPVAVVATQCIEVGANLDFDYLITEIASLDALRQRFGRLDRLGERVNRIDQLGDAMPGIIVATEQQVEVQGDDAKFSDRVYGQALCRTWAWLSAQSEVDFGMDAIEPILPDGEVLAGLCQKTLAAYPLLPAHLDLLAQTNPQPEPEPDIAAFLHGTTACSPDVTVIWRCDLPDHRTADWADRVALQRPVTGEGCSVPIWEFRRWLAHYSGSQLEDDGDVEGVTREDDIPASRRPVLRWRGIGDARVVDAATISPGDVVVVPSAYGGCDGFGWSPAATQPVSDIGDAVAFQAGRRPVLRLASLDTLLPSLADSDESRAAADDLRMWASGDVDAPAPDKSLSRLASAPSVPEWLAGLASHLARDQRRKLVTTAKEFAIVGARSSGEDLSTAEDGSSSSVKVSLKRHCVRVRGYAKRSARTVGLPPSVVADIALAAVLHDIGKADPRFQQWLHGGDEIAAALAKWPLAKSGMNPRDRAAIRRARKLAGYPKDARHEVQSLALIQHQERLRTKANDWDLVQHLVVAHHGFGRPFAPPVFDPEPVQVELELGPLSLSGTSNHMMHRIDSGIADRYWRLTRRYGWWGLAWLETILRLADHRRSQDEEHLDRV